MSDYEYSTLLIHRSLISIDREEKLTIDFQECFHIILNRDAFPIFVTQVGEKFKPLKISNQLRVFLASTSNYIPIHIKFHHEKINLKYITFLINKGLAFTIKISDLAKYQSLPSNQLVSIKIAFPLDDTIELNIKENYVLYQNLLLVNTNGGYNQIYAKEIVNKVDKELRKYNNEVVKFNGIEYD